LSENWQTFHESDVPFINCKMWMCMWSEYTDETPLGPPTSAARTMQALRQGQQCHCVLVNASHTCDRFNSSFPRLRGLASCPPWSSSQTFYENLFTTFEYNPDHRWTDKWRQIHNLIGRDSSSSLIQLRL